MAARSSSLTRAQAVERLVVGTQAEAARLAVQQEARQLVVRLLAVKPEAAAREARRVGLVVEAQGPSSPMAARWCVASSRSAAAGVRALRRRCSSRYSV